jgi:hypothetical protein
MQLIVCFCVRGVGQPVSTCYAGRCLVYCTNSPMTDECGAVDKMRIGRGSWSTRREPTPEPHFPPQIPHDPTWNRTRAAAWADRAQLIVKESRESPVLWHSIADVTKPCHYYLSYGRSDQLNVQSDPKIRNEGTLIKLSVFWKPITVAARSQAWSVFGRWNPGIVGSNPIQGMELRNWSETKRFTDALCSEVGAAGKREREYSGHYPSPTFYLKQRFGDWTPSPSEDRDYLGPNRVELFTWGWRQIQSPKRPFK